jgi:hypothetical protein
MKTTTQSAEIGQVLSFDERDYNTAINLSRSIISAIDKMALPYGKLGLGLFDQAVYVELVSNGTVNFEVRLREMIEEDLKGFKSPIALQSALKDIDAHLAPLQEALKNLKDVVARANANGGYGSASFNFGYDSFNIVDGLSQVKHNQLKQFYTKSITNARQVEVLNKLHELAALHNEVVDRFKEYGIDNVPIIGDPHQQSFIPLDYKENGIGFICGPKRHVNIKLIQIIK